MSTTLPVNILLSKDLILFNSSLNDSVVKGATQWWREGGIPTIMWHWGAPGIGEGYPNSKKEIDINKCFEKGTVEYNSFWTEIKVKADLWRDCKKQIFLSFGVLFMN